MGQARRKEKAEDVAEAPKEQPSGDDASKDVWVKPQVPSRLVIGVLLGLVVLFNLPLIHYYFFRQEMPTTVQLPFHDDFSSSDELKKNYWSSGGLWRIEDGQLLSPGVKNNPLWLRASLPQDVVVEFDVRSMSPEGDIKAEIFGNGSDHASGYILVQGGWNNSLSIIARLDEHGASLGALQAEANRIAAQQKLPNADLIKTNVFRKDTHMRVEANPYRVEMGRTYHWRIERRGGDIIWSIDGKPYMEFNDPYPLAGKGHDRFGFSSWESQLYFDNLSITAGNASAQATPQPVAPQPVAPQPPAETGTALTDNFDRDTLGDQWKATGPDAVSLESGSLTLQMTHNRPVWLQRPIPQDAVIEFDAWTDSPDGDLKVEAWGDGHSFYQGDLKLQYTATGYVFIFGGWHNTGSVIAKQWEHAPNEPRRTDVRVEPGHKYHWRIVRQGNRIDWSIDGQPFLSVTDPQPLVGPDHSYFAFSGWESKVHFDNLSITPAG